MDLPPLPKRREQPWKSRYTWEVQAGVAHPEFTYDDHPDAETAEYVAALMLRAQAGHGNPAIALRAVHVKGPEDAGPGWRLIELHS